jgi:hypothetical protein
MQTEIANTETAAAWTKTPTPTETLTPTATSTTIPSPTPDPYAGWLRFSDGKLNISLLHPQSWFKYPAPDTQYPSSAIIASYDLNQANPSENKPDPKKIKLDLIIVDGPEDISLEEWINSGLSSELTDVNIEKISLSGANGYKVTYVYLGFSNTEIYIPVKENILLISFQNEEPGNEELIGQILNTLKIGGE